jgi:TolB-like protein/Tfp pilus assembly protein PilF
MASNGHPEPTGLLTQLRERRIWRVLIAYPGMTFVLLQGIEFFINNYDLDPRYLTAGIVVSVVLLPAAVLWNWRHGEAGHQRFVKTEIGVYLISLIAAGLAVGWYLETTPAETAVAARPDPAVRTVAVLPFENTGGEPQAQYLCDGIAESLINWLAMLPNVKVASKSASFRLRDQADDLEAIAAALGVDSVVRGRLEHVGDQVVVSVSLVDARDHSQLWGERLMQADNDMLALEREIVAAIQGSLEVEFGGEPVTGIIGGTENPEAYEHYLRGHFLIQATDFDTIYEGIDELRVAIKTDPAFARPYADISDSLSQMLSYGLLQDETLLGEARNAAYTAVALAPDLAEAQTAMATVQQYIEQDWSAVDAAYDAAIALEPTSPVPYHRFTDWLVLTLRFDKAREMAARAIALDPLDSSSQHAVGLVELMDGNFDAAVDAFGDWNRFHPNSRWSYVKHALALSLNGECEAAQKQAAIVDELNGGRSSALLESWLAWGYKVCGNEEWYARSKSRIEAATVEMPVGVDPGVVYLAALEGEDEKITDWLTRVVENREPFTSFARIFTLDYLGWGISGKMANNQRYQDLLEEIGFPEVDPG